MKLTEIMCRQFELLPHDNAQPTGSPLRYVLVCSDDGNFRYRSCAGPGADVGPWLPAVAVSAQTTVEMLLPTITDAEMAHVVLDGQHPAGLVTSAEWMPVMARKLQEAKLRLRDLEEWKAHMESIFELSSSDLFTTDARGVVTRASALAEELYGMPAGRMVGRRVRELELENTFFPSATQAALQTGRRQVVVQRTASGRRLVVTATPVRDNSGQVTQVVGLVRDVTDTVSLEQEIERTREMNMVFYEDLRRYFRQQTAEHGLAVQSSEMRRVLMLAEQVSKVDSNVLILGESGVGKGVIARRIHELSPRRSERFIKVDCAALPPSLIESELFGYEKGSFTGAQSSGKIGLVEMADSGTLFLDEIGELPLEMQSKLLRVIQDREFYRVGSIKPVRVNVRILSATNKDLADEVRAGRFRRDLYYRLNVVPVRVPPLRERPEDIPVLVEHFLEYFGEKYDRPRALGPQTMQILMDYHWPGNVRHLENVIERLVVTTNNPIIQPSDLDEDLLPRGGTDGPTVSVRDVVPLQEAIEAVEVQLLRLARQRFRTETKMAQALGVHQSTVSRMLQRYYARPNEAGSSSDDPHS